MSSMNRNNQLNLKFRKFPNELISEVLVRKKKKRKEIVVRNENVQNFKGIV